MNPGDVAVLARQSTNKSQQSESIPKQLDCLREFAAQIGWPFPESERRLYRAITSGMAPVRPDLDRLIADMASGAVRRVLVYDWSRATRSALTSCGLWQAIKDCGAKLAVQSLKRVLDAAAGEDQLLISVLGLFNETHWLNHARMIRDGMHRKARMGRWVAPVPFGFRREGGILVPDEAEAPALERQLDLVRRFGCREASRILAKEGSRVAPSTLSHRFNNPAYKGTLVYGRTRMEFAPDPRAKLRDHPRRARRRCGPGEVCVLESAFVSPVPPAALAALPEDAQARRHNRGGVGIRGDGGFLLAGLAWCALCGNRLARTVAVRKRTDGSAVRYDYVGCDRAECPNRRLRREAVETRFLARLRFSLREPEAMLAVIVDALRRRCAKAADEESRFGLERRRWAQAKGRLDGLSPGEVEGDPLLSGTRRKVEASLREAEAGVDRSAAIARLSEREPEVARELLAWMSDFSSRWEELGRRERLQLLRAGLFKVLVGRPEITFVLRRPA